MLGRSRGLRGQRADRVAPDARDYTVALGRLKRHWKHAFHLLRLGLQDALQADAPFFHAAISCCKSSGWISALHVLRHMPARLLQPRAAGIGAAMAASPGEVWTLALDLARAIPAPSEISCCTVLTKLQSAACWLAAMDMLQGMPLLRIQPDMISCSSAAS
ncbi:unnamed protein product [Effrenium voratum]|nr:unnamed protein product [Effrenium voratum]